MAAKSRRKGKAQKIQGMIPALTVLVLFAALLITLQTFGFLHIPGLPTWSEISQSAQNGEKKAEPVTAPSANAGDAQVHFIDVGQGDSTLLLGDSFAVLLDAGEWEAGDKVVDYLETYGVKKLDYVIASHPHADHIGGLRVVLDAYPVDTLIMPELKKSLIPTTKTYEKFLDAIERNGCDVEAAEMGESYELAAGVSLQLLGPSGDFDDLNNMSVAARFTYGEVSFDIMGDMEHKAENAVLKAGLDVRADVMALGHHGSSTSSNKKFLDAAGASYYVAQCGYDNDYGHPHNETVAAVQERGGTLYRSDLHGNVIFFTDGNDLRVHLQKKAG